jgi:hypothetical protein
MICTGLFKEESKNGSSSVVPGPSEVNRRTQAFRRGPGTVPLIAVYCDETAAAECLLTAAGGMNIVEAISIEGSQVMLGETRASYHVSLCTDASVNRALVG